MAPMACLLALSSVLIATTLAAPYPMLNETSLCNSQAYNPKTYVCYADSVLCPIINGTDTLPCGDDCFDPQADTCYYDTELCPIINGEADNRCGDACYTSYRYSCIDDVLMEKPFRKGAYTLSAKSPTAPFDLKPIQAAGNHFYIGGHASTYCPSAVGKICGSYPNDTTLFRGGSLGSTVPGGQALYWQTDGSLTFTQAHSTSMYNLSYYGGGVAYQNGGFYGPHGEEMVACPSGSNAPWKVMARLSNVTFPSSCVGVYVGVMDSNLTAAAWQYV